MDLLSRSLLARAALAALGALAAVPVASQESPFNVSQVSNFDQSGQRYADVWGDGDYAYLAHFGQSRVDIVDISVPSSPQLVATYNSGVGSAQDVKVADGLMFVGLESATPGIHIVDVRDPSNPVKLTNVTVRSAVHNVFYHEGWLYLCDSSTPRIDIVDLRSYDPDNAPATISSATWTILNVGFFVHDITVQGDYLFASAWNSLRVFDISNLESQAPTFLTSVPGSNVHSSWATDDLRFLVTAEERTGGGLTLWEIVETAEPGAISLVQRDTYTVPTSRATSVHNPVIRDHTVYVSWYQIGTQIFEIDPVLEKLALIGSFDTTAINGNTGFSGNWGVYPFLGDDRLLASDTNTGLWVLDADTTSAPTLSVEGACPGSATLTISRATPSAEVAVIAAANTNGFEKGGALCNGSLLNVGEPFNLPPRFVIVDANGNGSTQTTLEAGFCRLQALDFANCRRSAPVSVD
jgi:hypothetical protein